MTQAIVHANDSDNEMGPLNAKQSKWSMPILDVSLPGIVVENLNDIGIDDVTVVSNEPMVDNNLDCEVVTERRFLDLDPEQKTLVVSGDTVYDWSRIEEMVENHETALGYSGVQVQEDGLHLQTNDGLVTEFASDYGEYSANAYLFPAGFYDETQYEMDLLQDLVLDYDVSAVDVGHTNKIQYPHEFAGFALKYVDVEGAVGLNGDEPDVANGVSFQGTVILMGDNEIGPGAVLEDCILMPGASVGANSYVGYSILGEEVRFGPSVTTEYDNGGDTVKLDYAEGRRDSGFKRFGAVVGPRAEVRAGATLTEGTVLFDGNVVREGVVR